MKLKDWADKQGISYLTAWRWFRAGDPRLAKAYQSDSGTIIVPDEIESSEQTMAGNTHNDVMSLFLKKTVEFSKNNSSIEDFAAYVLTNFSLKLNSVSDVPKYSKHKPKSEEVQKHFQQFLPDKEKEEHLKAVKTLLKEQNQTKEPYPHNLEGALFVKEPELFTKSAKDVDFSVHDLNDLDDLGLTLQEISDTQMYGEDPVTGGLITRNVDLSTPQQINYTGSTSQPSSDYFSTTNSMTGVTPSASVMYVSGPTGPTGPDASFGVRLSAFIPTGKEYESANKVVAELQADSLPRKRGRKPSKKAPQ